jgi:hypothetical protein
LAQYPSAHAIKEAWHAHVADVFINQSRGNKPRAGINVLMDAATSSVGVTSPAKKLTLKQEASLLMHVEEQMKEAKKLLMSLLNKRMKEDTDILC